MLAANLEIWAVPFSLAGWVGPAFRCADASRPEEVQAQLAPQTTSMKSASFTSGISRAYRVTPKIGSIAVGRKIAFLLQDQS